MWQRNSSPVNLEWISFSAPLSTTKDALSHRLQTAMNKAAPQTFHLLSTLPTSHPLLAIFHDLEKKLETIEIPAPSSSTLLLLTNQLAQGGQLAASASDAQLSGIVVTWQEDSFFLTAFDHHHFHTDHWQYNDLALPSSLSHHEKEILSLGLLLYSGGTFSSLLEAVDQARRILRGQD